MTFHREHILDRDLETSLDERKLAVVKGWNKRRAGPPPHVCPARVHMTGTPPGGISGAAGVECFNDNRGAIASVGWWRSKLYSYFYFKLAVGPLITTRVAFRTISYRVPLKPTQPALSTACPWIRSAAVDFKGGTSTVPVTGNAKVRVHTRYTLGTHAPSSGALSKGQGGVWN